MDTLTYPVLFQKDKDGYFVTIPDLDRMTQGLDLTDAIANARDVICLTIVDLEDDGKPVPLLPLLSKPLMTALFHT